MHLLCGVCRAPFHLPWFIGVEAVTDGFRTWVTACVFCCDVSISCWLCFGLHPPTEVKISRHCSCSSVSLRLTCKQCRSFIVENWVRAWETQSYSSFIWNQSKEKEAKSRSWRKTTQQNENYCLYSSCERAWLNNSWHSSVSTWLRPCQ